MPNKINALITFLILNVPFVAILRRQYLQKKEYQAWLQSDGRLGTPHIIKQKVVKELAAEFKIEMLIETGTYFGDMDNSVKDDFLKIISIELSSQLYEFTNKRFAKFKHIEIINGDSADVIVDVLKRIDRKCLFWLDGHFSGGITERGSKDSPIMEELTSIFEHDIKDHVILIDDAHCFDGKNDYPAMEELQRIVELTGNYSFSLKYDIIRLTPKKC